MKKITLVRHAKSSWKHDVGDLNRPLKKRGIVDVEAVSKEFKIKHLYPEIVFSSPARRALDTCKKFLDEIDFSYKNICISEEIYDFGGHRLTNFIKSINNDFSNVMLFGHNYALTYFANTYGDISIENLPTSGLVVFEFDIDSWEDLKPGRIIDVLIPKNLRGKF